MKRVLSMLLAVAAVFTAAPTFAAGLDDADALQGVKTGKAVFDVSLGEPAKLALHLAVIKETHEGLVKQGVKPDFIILLRGPAVLPFAQKPAASAQPDETARFTAELNGMTAKEIARLTAALKDLGVRFEVCGLATRLLKVDNATIVPQAKVVANTFVSLIGYQSKGYAIIPIM